MILHALTENEITNVDGTLDVYAFIRSPEILNYMRENREFSIHDKAAVVLESMNPYEIKQKALKLLAEDPAATEEQRMEILLLNRLIETSLEEMYHPSKPAVFSVRCCSSVENETLNAYERADYEHNCSEYFGSLQEFIKLYEGFGAPEGEDLFTKFEIDLVYPGCSQQTNNPLSCTAAFFDGKISVYSLNIRDFWAKERGLSRIYEAYFQFQSLSRYSLPFPSLSRVQLQTPMMEEPLCGILDSSMDGCGCWYHFFYPEDSDGEKSMDFSYHLVDWSSGLSIFDWLFQDDREPAPEELAKVFGVRCLKWMKTIEDLKKDGSGDIIARALRITREEEPQPGRLVLHLELQDESGSIIVPVDVFAEDRKWMDRAAKEHEWLEMHVSTFRDEAGNFLSWHAGDIRRIAPETIEKIRKAVQAGSWC